MLDSPRSTSLFGGLSCALLLALAAAIGCKKPEADVAPPAASPGDDPAPAAVHAEPEAKPEATPEGAEAAPAPAPSAPPKIAPHTVLRPVFDTAQGEARAGTASLVRWSDGQVLLLTAHHLLGKAGGLGRDYRGDELAEAVRGVAATSVDDPAVRVTSSSVVVIPDAATMKGQEARHDLAAFRVETPAGAAVLPLATAAPAKDERVYLLAEVDGSDARVHGATVVATMESMMVYAFDESFEASGPSGAAVVNGRGEVVGIHLGGGKRGGKRFGSANPLPAVRDNLTRALQPKSD